MFNRLFTKVCGYATTTDVGGVLKVYFPFIPVAADYEVLETDYESYACVYSCAADILGIAHTEIGYILTREQEYNQELVSAIKCLKINPIIPKNYINLTIKISNVMFLFNCRLTNV